tara:strand:+ start:579 stop:782 length:204 start_codon:yes stop_codon:yes gene_type:complete
MKYLLLPCALFCLSSCAQTGKLIGGVVTLPIKVLSKTAGSLNKYDDAGAPITAIPDIDQAMPMNMTE